MKNKEAIIILKGIQCDIMPHDELSGQRTEDVAFSLAIKALEAQGWIPVKTRELTAEEKEEHPDSIFMWDCPLPDIPQDVLITTKWGDVQLCTFCADDMGSYFDEVDWDFVLAWMPLPEPYKKEDDT